ncbi:MAG: DUF3426 domain-containing protein [Thermodesulfobacteriota bacterium]|nr:DUF3426 domain-containing protein [Thermodesulfobacteriota bacterium]
MITQCEKCRTKFRLDDDRVPEEGIKGRCSRCGHVFLIQKTTTLNWEFTEENEREEEFEGFTLQSPEVAASVQKKKYLSAGLLSVLILILLAGGMWLFWNELPHIREKTLATSNIKRYFRSNKLPQKDVVFSSSKTRGYYIDNKSHGRFFVIEGEAINNSSEVKRFIRVKGALFDSSGNKVADKDVYCGKILSEKELMELDPTQIRSNLNYYAEDPPVNLNLPPQKSIPFMIVFFDLPEDLKEFSVEAAK